MIEFVVIIILLFKTSTLIYALLTNLKTIRTFIKLLSSKAKSYLLFSYRKRNRNSKFYYLFLPYSITILNTTLDLSEFLCIICYRRSLFNTSSGISLKGVVYEYNSNVNTTKSQTRVPNFGAICFA